jgi:DNA invertase Pin-like site-specific DNA recombinase
MSRERKRASADQVQQSSPFRCAIYTRKSTEEGLAQEFNTLEAQRESAEAYVQSQVHTGWTTLAERYDDGGYTGANWNDRLCADCSPTSRLVESTVCWYIR